MEFGTPALPLSIANPESSALEQNRVCTVRSRWLTTEFWQGLFEIMKGSFLGPLWIKMLQVGDHQLQDIKTKHKKTEN
jgi:hypothetical protein